MINDTDNNVNSCGWDNERLMMTIDDEIMIEDFNDMDQSCIT